MKFFTDDEMIELQSEINEGWIDCTKHPEFDFYIYNYSKKAQYRFRWNKYTTVCRGLILNGSGELVAKGFDKFFNYDQLVDMGIDNTIPNNEKFTVFEKVDGSIGIMYFNNNVPYIATRGSFVSDMAIETNKWLSTTYSNIKFNSEYSYIFEIIYPENKIVVDYGDIREIVLLGVIDNKTLKEKDIYSNEFDHIVNGGIRRANTLNDVTNWESLSLNDSINFEGYVIHFNDSNFRMKLKTNWYLKVSYNIRMANKKTLWDLMLNHKDVDAYITDFICDELHTTAIKYYNELQSEYDNIVEHIIDEKNAFLKFLDLNFGGIDFLNKKDIVQQVRQFDTDVEFHYILNVLNNKANLNHKHIMNDILKSQNI